MPEWSGEDVGQARQLPILEDRTRRKQERLIHAAEANCRKAGATDRRGAIAYYVKRTRFG